MSNDDLTDYHTSSPSTELPEFQRAIMYCLNRAEQPHGLAINERLEGLGYEVHHGRLYPALDRLRERDLIAKQSDGRTNRYSLTSDGREWLNTNRDKIEQFLADDSNRRPGE